MGVVTWRRRLSDLLLSVASRLMFAAMRADPTRVKIELKVAWMASEDEVPHYA